LAGRAPKKEVTARWVFAIYFLNRKKMKEAAVFAVPIRGCISGCRPAGRPRLPVICAAASPLPSPSEVEPMPLAMPGVLECDSAPAPRPFLLLI
jgi:hypothetical protein